MNTIIKIAVLVVSINTVAQGQVAFTKNQFSIDASKFVLIFNEQVENLDLMYRLSIDSVSGFRVSSSLDLSSADDAINAFSVRLGLDRIFLKSGNWKFYTGVDFNYSINRRVSNDRVNRSYGPILFLGFLYHFGSHFSVLSEPSLALFRKTFSDPSSFNPDPDQSSLNLNMINIGQIRVNFHF